MAVPSKEELLLGQQDMCWIRTKVGRGVDDDQGTCGLADIVKRLLIMRSATFQWHHMKKIGTSKTGWLAHLAVEFWYRDHQTLPPLMVVMVDSIWILESRS